MDINHENLRAEALQFADGLPPFPDHSAEPLSQPSRWRGCGCGCDCVFDATAAGGQLPSPRFHLYARVCVLFVGHPYLFNRFERLQFMNDGRERTRRQIRRWRDHVRQEFLYRINSVIEDYRSAIETLLFRPGNLSFRDAEVIESTRIGVAGDDDPFPVMDLMYDTIGWRQFYLPGLHV